MKDETPREPEIHLNFEAAEELERQGARAKSILEALAADLAFTEPRRVAHWKCLVEREHVLQAAAKLFGSAIPSATSPTSANCVFISYSNQDKGVARELANDLKRLGVACFIANRSIRTAADWVESIGNALRNCRCVLLSLTPPALRSDWCKYEAGAALLWRKTIVPALRGVTVAELPEVFRRFQAVNIDTRRGQRELIKHLKEMCQREEPPE